MRCALQLIHIRACVCTKCANVCTGNRRMGRIMRLCGAVCCVYRLDCTVLVQLRCIFALYAMRCTPVCYNSMPSLHFSALSSLCLTCFAPCCSTLALFCTNAVRCPQTLSSTPQRGLAGLAVAVGYAWCVGAYANLTVSRCSSGMLAACILPSYAYMHRRNIRVLWYA